MEDMRAFESEFPPYPIQNALAAGIRREATRSGNADYMSLWAGQAAPLARAMPARQLVECLADELHETLGARPY